MSFETVLVLRLFSRPNYREQMKPANELKLYANQPEQNRQITAIVQWPDTRILLTAVTKFVAPLNTV